MKIKKIILSELLAEIKYYGEFAPQEHLFEQYGILIKENERVEDVAI